MADDEPPPPPRRLRERVHFFERVWSGAGDVTDASTSSPSADVADIERRIKEEQQRKRRHDAPKIEVKLKHTERESPTRSFESAFPSYKLRHVEHPVEETVERHVEEGDLASGVRFIKFERMTVKRTVTSSSAESTDRPESPQQEWYSEFKAQGLQGAPKMYHRSKSEYDSHIAEIRGKVQ